MESPRDPTWRHGGASGWTLKITPGVVESNLLYRIDEMLGFFAASSAPGGGSYKRIDFMANLSGEVYFLLFLTSGGNGHHRSPGFLKIAVPPVTPGRIPWRFH